jgi:DNA-directed RNA polymerase subunit omega
MKGSSALVVSKNKPAVTALREIAAHKVYFERPSHEVVAEWIDENQKRRENGGG